MFFFHLSMLIRVKRHPRLPSYTSFVMRFVFRDSLGWWVFVPHHHPWDGTLLLLLLQVGLFPGIPWVGEFLSHTITHEMGPCSSFYYRWVFFQVFPGLLSFCPTPSPMRWDPAPPSTTGGFVFRDSLGWWVFVPHHHPWDGTLLLLLLQVGLFPGIP